MAERIQPLSDVGPVRHVPAQPRTAARTPSFSELVHAHQAWWLGRQGSAPDRAAEAEYDSMHGAFEAAHGRIVRAYWCSDIPSAVALTEKTRLRGRVSSTFSFHRESDWATKNVPDVAAELHRCDALAVRAKAVLTGVRQRICLELVVSCAANLLSLVDKPAARSGDEDSTAEALDRERAAIRKVESYYCDAANGQAQLIYFGGIATVTLVIAAAATVWLSISWAAPVAALVAGALGAVVSVIQRINSGVFELEYDVGGPYTFFLGGLRPVLGGVFAMAITFAISGGLVHLPIEHQHADSRRFALLVLAFLAGFSERWAQDTLTAIVPAAAPPAPAPAGSHSSPTASLPHEPQPQKGAGHESHGT